MLQSTTFCLALIQSGIYMLEKLGGLVCHFFYAVNYIFFQSIISYNGMKNHNGTVYYQMNV
jgi:hypothetical protein